jgi:hypothetical protein
VTDEEDPAQHRRPCCPSTRQAETGTSATPGALDRIYGAAGCGRSPAGPSAPMRPIRCAISCASDRSGARLRLIERAADGRSLTSQVVPPISGAIAERPRCPSGHRDRAQWSDHPYADRVAARGILPTRDGPWPSTRGRAHQHRPCAPTHQSR